MRPFCLALAFLLSATAAAAQPPPLAAAWAPGLSDSARVSLLTMVPGQEVYSLFGHSAFRIHDPVAGIDRTYNFGTFDFEQPFFLARFARGELLYRLDTAPYADEIAKYQWLGRPVIEQTLALDPPAVRALYSALEINALPENREYRYDFLFDNCSTRLLAALDTALVRTGRPPVALAPRAAPETFREQLAPYLVGVPAVELGVGLALGLPTDQTPTARQATFLPLDLAAALDGATVAGQPLVARRDTVFSVPGAGMPRQALRWPLAVAWLTLAAAVGLTATVQRRTGSARRVFDAVLFGAVGVAGGVLFLLWTATAHAVTRPNLNLLWAWPTHLAAAILLARPAGPPRWMRPYLIATAAVSLAVVGTVAAGWSPQPLPAEAVPLALALAVRAGAQTLALQPGRSA